MAGEIEEGFRPKTAPPPVSKDQSFSIDNNSSSGAQNFLVAVRIRPANTEETSGPYKNIVKPVDEQVLCFDPKPEVIEDISGTSYMSQEEESRLPGARRYKDLKFAFDRVFAEDATQQAVYEATARKLLPSVLEGYNATVFCYGATGAGKTYTMMGSESVPGIMTLTIAGLYEAARKNTDQVHRITCSFIEIYNETIRDLFVAVPDGSKPRLLSLREDPRLGPTVTALTEIEPHDATHCVELLRQGIRNRAQSATAANEQSSRSHAVFQIKVESRDATANTDENVRLSKLSLIDLAGSERAAKTKNRGKRLLEGANINTSLLALGNCINALCNAKPGRPPPHVPYRDSKLTRLLKDSLGGSCKTCMISNLSPSDYGYEDTLNTLRYADRAKSIKTVAVKNEVRVKHSVSAYSRIISDLRKEMERLKEENTHLKRVGESGELGVEAPSVVREREAANEIHGEMKPLIWRQRELRTVYARLHYDNEGLEERVADLERDLDAVLGLMGTFSGGEEMGRRFRAALRSQTDLPSIEEEEFEVLLGEKGNEQKMEEHLPTEEEIAGLQFELRCACEVALRRVRDMIELKEKISKISEKKDAIFTEIRNHEERISDCTNKFPTIVSSNDLVLRFNDFCRAEHNFSRAYEQSIKASSYQSRQLFDRRMVQQQAAEIRSLRTALVETNILVNKMRSELPENTTSEPSIQSHLSRIDRLYRTAVIPESVRRQIRDRASMLETSTGLSWSIESPSFVVKESGEGAEETSAPTPELLHTISIHKNGSDELQSPLLGALRSPTLQAGRNGSGLGVTQKASDDLANSISSISLQSPDRHQEMNPITPLQPRQVKPILPTPTQSMASSIVSPAHQKLKNPNTPPHPQMSRQGTIPQVIRAPPASQPTQSLALDAIERDIAEMIAQKENSSLPDSGVPEHGLASAGIEEPDEVSIAPIPERMATKQPTEDFKVADNTSSSFPVQRPVTQGILKKDKDRFDQLRRGGNVALQRWRNQKKGVKRRVSFDEGTSGKERKSKTNNSSTRPPMQPGNSGGAIRAAKLAQQPRQVGGGRIRRPPQTAPDELSRTQKFTELESMWESVQNSMDKQGGGPSRGGGLPPRGEVKTVSIDLQ